MRKTRNSLIALAAAGVLALTACGDDNGGGSGGAPDPSEFPEGSTMARIAEEGTITIGTKFDQPLFGLQGPDGVPVGSDDETGKRTAGALGVAAAFVEERAGRREPLIENGSVEIVVASYTIHDTRKEVVDFAGPYYIAGQPLMVLQDNTDINGP